MHCDHSYNFFRLLHLAVVFVFDTGPARKNVRSNNRAGLWTLLPALAGYVASYFCATHEVISLTGAAVSPQRDVVNSTFHVLVSQNIST